MPPSGTKEVHRGLRVISPGSLGVVLHSLWVDNRIFEALNEDFTHYSGL